MKRAGLFLLVILFSLSASLRSQERHDVLLLHDNTIVRGTITEIAPNKTTYITTVAGRQRICLWDEIRRRLQVPVGLPDSLLTLEHILFLRPMGDGDNEEDVLLLKNETQVRGLLLRPSRPGPACIWTSGNAFLTIPGDQIKEAVRLDRQTSDSTIDLYYIHPTAELLADNYRILIVEAGGSIGVGPFARPTDDLLVKGGFGFSVGCHAGLRVASGWRWATSVIFMKQGIGFSSDLEDLWAEGDLPAEQLLWGLTGVEYRREGTSPLKFLGFAQVGIVSSRLESFTFSTKPTRVTREGTGTQTSSQGIGFAFSLGVGVTRGAFSVMTRYLSGTVKHDYTTTLVGAMTLPAVWKFNGDQSIGVFQLTLGFSPF